MRTSRSQRNTEQRRVILEELRVLKSHPTAADLYDIVRKRLPRISLGTVYRNLELLVDSGVIRKVEIGGRGAHFDAVVTDHHHVCCVRCSRVDDLPNSQDIQISNLGIAPEGWEIHERQVDLIGLCPDCIA